MVDAVLGFRNLGLSKTFQTQTPVGHTLRAALCIQGSKGNQEKLNKIWLHRHTQSILLIGITFSLPETLALSFKFLVSQSDTDFLDYKPLRKRKVSKCPLILNKVEMGGGILNLGNLRKEKTHCADGSGNERHWG